MAQKYPKLVNKQFNSPINLYSDSNVREVIERETQLLTNGALGINFYNPNTTTPPNLKNSAVMRLIQENEQPRTESNSNLRTHDGRQSWPPPDNKAVHKIQFGVSGLKRVAWPPPSAEEHLVEVSPDQVVKAQNSSGPANYANQSSPRSGYSTPSSQQGLANNYQQPAYQQQISNQHQQPPYQQQHQPAYQQQHSYQQPPSYQQQQPSYQQQHSYQQQPHYQPAYQQQSSFSPIQNQTPSSFTPVQQPAKQWSSVSSPTPTSPVPQGGPQSLAYAPGFQSSSQVFSPSAQSYQNTVPAYPKEQEIQQPRGPTRPPATQPQKQFEPPPQTITLRAEAPMSQKPAPVYNAQPAAKVFKGGSFLRGDLKWPPPEVKKHMEEEKKHLEELAKGPAFKPRKMEKDYTDFFAQNALNSTYPGYKVPPGTLYYPHQPKYIKLS